MAGDGGLDGWTTRARSGFIFASVASTECKGVKFFFLPFGKEKSCVIIVVFVVVLLCCCYSSGMEFVANGIVMN